MSRKLLSQRALVVCTGLLLMSIACDDSTQSKASPPTSGTYGAGSMDPAQGITAAANPNGVPNQSSTPGEAITGSGASAGSSPIPTDSVPMAGTTNDANDSNPSTGMNDMAASPDSGVDAGRGGPEPEQAAAPPVELPTGIVAMFPLPESSGLCTDPALRLEFAGPPTLGNSGAVRVWLDGQPQPVASIELGVGPRTVVRGGREFKQLPAAHLDGNAVVFPLSPGTLARGESYYVTVDSGVVRAPSGRPFVVDDDSTWRFQTAAQGPSDPTELRVGLDGDAHFCTVQGAIDAVPDNNQTPTTIAIGEGKFYGVVHWTRKSQLTLQGADREKTQLLGTNNNELNPSTRTRALFGVEGLSDLTIANLTIHNLTPQGGSQAEALALLSCDRCTVRDANILSFQDTLLWSGRIYAENCFIAGNVDFIWGSGAAFFKNCEIKMVGRRGYIVQARNDRDGYGYVFVDSKITADPGVSDAILARIDASAYPYSHVAFVDCELGAHISAGGWTVSGGLGSNLRFWEYGNTDPAGRPINTSQRVRGATQIGPEEAQRMRDPSVVLSGWNP